MTIEKAERILNITSGQYNLSTLRNEHYTKLLRIYHSDNNIETSNEEKESMIRKITSAYRIIKKHLENEEKSIAVYIDLQRKLEQDYTIEQGCQMLDISKIPEKIQFIIKDYYKKYSILYQSIKLKSCDQSYQNLFVCMAKYEETYTQYRKELTYTLFNYLESEVQKNFSNKSSLHDLNFREYCEKYDSESPAILNSIYDIVLKIITYLPNYVNEKQKIKNELHKYVMQQIKQKMIEYQKLQYYSFIEEELGDVLDHTTQTIDSLFMVSPEQTIDIRELRRRLYTFDSITKSIIEGYEQFLLSKDFIIDTLEETIDQKVIDTSAKTKLLLSLLPLYDELDMKHFYLQIDSLSQQLNCHMLPTEDDNQKKMLLP